MRSFLLSKFVCALCGSQMELTGETPKGKPSLHCPGEPTGAEKLEVVVAVKPCRCVTAPVIAVLHDVVDLKALQEKLENLLKQSEQQETAEEEKSDADRV